MAKSILLLIERRNGGKGPSVPVRTPILAIYSEGVAGSDFIMVHITRPDGGVLSHRIERDYHRFEEPIEPGSYMRAELFGINSLATVWAE